MIEKIEELKEIVKKDKVKVKKIISSSNFTTNVTEEKETQNLSKKYGKEIQNISDKYPTKRNKNSINSLIILIEKKFVVGVELDKSLKLFSNKIKNLLKKFKSKKRKIEKAKETKENYQNKLEYLFKIHQEKPYQQCLKKESLINNKIKQLESKIKTCDEEKKRNINDQMSLFKKKFQEINNSKIMNNHITGISGFLQKCKSKFQEINNSKIMNNHITGISGFLQKCKSKFQEINNSKIMNNSIIISSEETNNNLDIFPNPEIFKKYKLKNTKNINKSKKLELQKLAAKKELKKIELQKLELQKQINILKPKTEITQEMLQQQEPPDLTHKLDINSSYTTTLSLKNNLSLKNSPAC